MSNQTSNAKSGANIAKFILLNLIGIFMFFITITVGGKESIPVDHIVTYIRAIPMFETIYGTAIVLVGAVLPFLRKTWKKDTVTMVFSLLKLLAIPFMIMWLMQVGPARWFDSDMMPFIYNKVVLPVACLVPVGAVFLSFLINYGLMEFIGVFMRPVMRPLWKTPGRSAVDAVASFVGSYSVGLLITNRVYKPASTVSTSAIRTPTATASRTSRNTRRASSPTASGRRPIRTIPTRMATASPMASSSAAHLRPTHAASLTSSQTQTRARRPTRSRTTATATT